MSFRSFLNAELSSTSAAKRYEYVVSFTDASTLPQASLFGHTPLLPSFGRPASGTPSIFRAMLPEVFLISRLCGSR